MEATVVIVGGGPAGLATSVCLSKFSISNMILEGEDCYASLWKKRAYDRLSLHLAKAFCELPYMPHLSTTPTFMPKREFVRYLDTYVSHFDIKPHCNRCVVSAFFRESSKKWIVEAKNTISGETEVYIAKFLVVATGENGKPFIPEIPGMDSFPGEVVHSSAYKCGSGFENKQVLVVGSGNSGMEISFDLSNHGAYASLVVRSPVHVVTKQLIYMGMVLLKYLPMWFVDAMVTLLSRMELGDLSKFGIHRPRRGPFTHKIVTGQTPVLDVGTVNKIHTGEIKVVPAIDSINGNMVKFSDGVEKYFDAIVFATGYKSVANDWLKDYNYILNEEGMPRNPFPNHWKGENGAYCVGLARDGISGVSKDAIAVADDINGILSHEEKENGEALEDPS